MNWLRSSAVSAAVILAGYQLVGSAQAEDELAKRQYESGLRFLGQQRYDDALKDFRGVVEAYPATAVADDALLKIAQYQLEIAEDLTQAQTAADQLLQKYSLTDSAPGGLIIAGRILLGASRAPKEMSSALAQFERVSQLYPRSLSVPEALFWEGETQRLNSQPADALIRLGKVISDYPDSLPWAARALLSSALCDVAQDQPYEAMDALQRLRLRFPRSPEAERALAWNTQLYRLFVRSPIDAPYRFSGRTLTGPALKLKGVTSLAIDGRDALFAMNRDAVIGFNVDGSALPPPPSIQPRGLLVDHRGNLAVLQKGSLRPTKGAPIPLTAARPDGTARAIEEPTTAAALSSGEFLVADPSTRSVFKFTPQGKVLGSFVTGRAARIVVNSMDEFAALLKDDKRVAVFGRDGKVLRQLGPRSENYEFRNPVDIAYDALGHLFVLDRGMEAILIFGPTGKLRATLTIPEKTAGSLHDSTALAVDSTGRLFVYDDGTERIQIYQ